MSDDLEAIQASLKRLLASKDADRETHAKALTAAMQGIQAALTELIDMGERSDEAKKQHADAAEQHRQTVGDAADMIAMAIRSVRVEIPEVAPPIVNVEAPVVNVASPSVTVAAPLPAVNNITLTESDRPRPVRYEVEAAMDRYGNATGKMTITPVY